MASPRIAQELKDMTVGRGRLPPASKTNQERRRKLRLELGSECLFQVAQGSKKRHLEKTRQIEEELDQRDRNADEGQQVRA